jgi:hypothetical protein
MIRGSLRFARRWISHDRIHWLPAETIGSAFMIRHALPESLIEFAAAFRKRARFLRNGAQAKTETAAEPFWSLLYSHERISTLENMLPKPHFRIGELVEMLRLLSVRHGLCAILDSHKRIRVSRASIALSRTVSPVCLCSSSRSLHQKLSSSA